MNDNPKILCTECLCSCKLNDLLTAKNPFDKDEDIYACPKCFSINKYVLTCEYENCNNEYIYNCDNGLRCTTHYNK
jgi:hypothetical protein